MKMKRLIALMATVALSATMLVGCGSDKSGSEGGDSSKSEVSIGLSTDEGGINDKSFNQSANDGVLRAKDEFGVEYTYLEAQKKEDYEPNLQSLIDNGADLTFAIGYQLSDAVKAAAKNNPEAKFALVDSVVESDNVLSIVFKEEEGSFLVGVIAGLTTKTNKVGFIGGKDSEAIQKFEAGFAAGVAAVNPEAAKGLISSDGTSTGATVKYADSFADTNKGYELAKSLYNEGCDVIYHAAGGVGVGLFQATQELRNEGKDVWAIGVDMDQAVSLPNFADSILTSMIKRVDNSTYDAVKSVVDGNFEGKVLSLGIADGGVGIAETTSTNASEEAIAKSKEFEERIKNGEFEVPATREGVMEFKIN